MGFADWKWKKNEEIAQDAPFGVLDQLFEFLARLDDATLKSEIEKIDWDAPTARVVRWKEGVGPERGTLEFQLPIITLLRTKNQRLIEACTPEEFFKKEKVHVDYQPLNEKMSLSAHLDQAINEAFKMGDTKNALRFCSYASVQTKSHLFTPIIEQDRVSPLLSLAQGSATQEEAKTLIELALKQMIESGYAEVWSNEKKQKKSEGDLVRQQGEKDLAQNIFERLLPIAAKNGKLAVCKALIELGAPVGPSSLMNSIHCYHFDLFKLLLKTAQLNPSRFKDLEKRGWRQSEISRRPEEFAVNLAENIATDIQDAIDSKKGFYNEVSFEYEAFKECLPELREFLSWALADGLEIGDSKKNCESFTCQLCWQAKTLGSSWDKAVERTFKKPLPIEIVSQLTTGLKKAHIKRLEEASLKWTESERCVFSIALKEVLRSSLLEGDSYRRSGKAMSRESVKELLLMTVTQYNLYAQKEPATKIAEEFGFEPSFLADLEKAQIGRSTRSAPSTPHRPHKL